MKNKKQYQLRNIIQGVVVKYTVNGELKLCERDIDNPFTNTKYNEEIYFYY